MYFTGIDCCIFTFKNILSIKVYVNDQRKQHLGQSSMLIYGTTYVN
jgi:hypothetical protein